MQLANEQAWADRAEHGRGRRHARDRRIVRHWLLEGSISPQQFDAIEWYARALERAHGSTGGLGERVSASTAPDAAMSGQVEAMQRVTSADRAVERLAGKLCSQALPVMAVGQGRWRDIKSALGCHDRKLFQVCFQALEALAQYRAACDAEVAWWNARAMRH